MLLLQRTATNYLIALLVDKGIEVNVLIFPQSHPPIFLIRFIPCFHWLPYVIKQVFVNCLYMKAGLTLQMFKKLGISFAMN